MTIYIVRHAEAEGNVFRRCHGQYNSLLTPKGDMQARLVSNFFDDIDIDKIYSSDLIRTMWTATPLANKKNLEIIPNKNLRELSMGDWEDLTWADLPKVNKEQFEMWETAMDKCKIPNGETVDIVGERVYKAILEIADENKEKTIAVFCHALAIRCFLCKVMFSDYSKINQLPMIENTGVTKFDVTDGKITIDFIGKDTHLPDEMATVRNINNNKEGEIKLPASHHNLWFKNVDLTADKEMLLEFARDFYKVVYGNSSLLNEEDFLGESADILAVNEKAITFGMSDNKAVALVRLNVLNHEKENAGYIGNYFILEEYRSRGFSPQILGQAIHIYRNMNKEFLRVNVERNNARALKFYDKYGFVKVGEMDNHVGSHFVLEKDIRQSLPKI